MDYDGGRYGNVTFKNDGNNIKIKTNGDVVLLNKPPTKTFVVKIQASSGILTERSNEYNCIFDFYRIFRLLPNFPF